ncbi:Putative Ubiquitin-like domain, CAP Gly-rich domain, Ubiquitin-like domain superfamily [Septoria linicola]|uniref:Ubiquitin-like domain, CAP Gly-rich domain, Ubiquitin-like domain superfamily n=1 Tax=Septoria linicola TaxID=215465 RepID=A0A9Q9AQ35_9PEZI|nr:putative Ubiquitin-like domain, CAP Gly-rich domain, Ubiquitin-like domain superfamily [Septoria linicola]USW50001.1 Putative Ubiquitin-like domain, CAP Gly-rich domain, Ubiquitin-like domain superfamily [Septoria linicola]
MATSAADIPLLIRSENSSSERRISPAWSIAQLKSRLEPITGVPAGCQRLSLKVASQPAQNIEAADEEATQIGAWPLQAYAELQIVDTRPPGARTNYTDVSSVEKYELPKDEYENRTDSVLAWKKAHKLGRFDPNAPSIEQQKINTSYREVEERGIKQDARCRLLPEIDHRRGIVQYIGDVPEIAGGIGAWIGVKLDEPTGKNDGSVKGQRYFDCQPNYGVFVRAERVEVGDFPVLDEFADEDDEF